jgi:nucleotide-binding universal stress UspA family protein
MENFIYFVPVDFSACSYNALHYATMLARCSQGKINLCHVIDLEEVEDSENPVVISFMIDRLFKKTQKRMKSLREIISLEGIIVKEEIVMGNVEVQLKKQIDELKPNVIVMGRNTERKLGTQSLLKHITRNTTAPVLVVPQTHNPKIPNRAVLASDMDPNRVVEYAPFFDIIKKVSHDLSILNIRSNYFANSKEALTWVGNLNLTYGVNAKLLQQENHEGFKGIADLIRTNQIDLLCTVKHNNGFFDKFFDRNISNQLTNQADVPVLVIKE